MKITQTGILWSQAQVLVGPPEMKIPTLGLVFFLKQICRFSRQTPADTTNPTWDPTQPHEDPCFEGHPNPTRCKPLLSIVFRRLARLSK